MDYPKYIVTISYSPNRPVSQQAISLNGTTQSVPVYSGEWYIASMPELKISATGSDYTKALSNLLTIATASSTVDTGQWSWSQIKHY